VTLILEEGTYHMPSGAKGKTFEVIGSDDVTIEVVPAGQGEASKRLSTFPAFRRLP